MDQINSSDVNTEVANVVSTGNYGYVVREAVGVFSTREALERAVDELEVSGLWWKAGIAKSLARSHFVLSFSVIPHELANKMEPLLDGTQSCKRSPKKAFAAHKKVL